MGWLAWLNLKTKKGKLILAAIIVGSVLVAAAIIVPTVIVLTQKNANKTSSSALPEDAVAFNAKYGNALEISNDKVAVKKEAFAGRTDLPEGFTLPASVESIGANAFLRARLPVNFAIPDKTVEINANAFLQVSFDNDYYWDKSEIKAGSKVVLVEQNAEYASFNTAHPNILVNKKTIKRAAFQKVNLSKGISLPSFVTYIDHYAFAGATLPKGFQLPSSLTSIGNYAFRGTTMPTSFAIPASFRAIGKDLQNSPLGYISFAGTIFSAGFKIPDTVEQIYYAAFSLASVQKGFSIPATTKIYAFDGLAWTTSTNQTLDGIQIPSDCKWDNPNGAMTGATVVAK